MANHIILVKAPRTIITIQDLVDTIRDWEINSPIGSTLPTLFTAGGKERLDATNLVGITMTLWGWTVQFEARNGPATVLCEVIGGNLVAQSNLYDDQVGTTDSNPFTPSAYVQVTYAKSASPTLTVTSGSGIDASVLAAAVRAELAPELTHILTLENNPGLTSTQATMLLEIYNLYGLDPTKPLVVTNTTRSSGDSITQTIQSNDSQTIITRV